MEITIKGTSKEIADLVMQLQSQQNPESNIEIRIDSNPVWKSTRDMQIKQDG